MGVEANIQIPSTGTQNWLGIVKAQIEEQEMRGLMMVRRDIDAIMRFRHGVGIASVLKNDDLQVGFGAKRDRIFEMKLKRTLASISKVIFPALLIFLCQHGTGLIFLVFLGASKSGWSLSTYAEFTIQQCQI